MHLVVLAIDLHLPQCRSLKEKRALVRPIVVQAQQRFRVSAAEVAAQDLHQRASIAMAIVGPSQRHLAEVADELERWVWSHPEIEVLSCRRTWLRPEW